MSNSNFNCGDITRSAAILSSSELIAATKLYVKLIKKKKMRPRWLATYIPGLQDQPKFRYIVHCSEQCKES